MSGAKLKILYRGVAITYAECDKCREQMQYLTDKPYRYCPYCGSKVTEDRKESK